MPSKRLEREGPSWQWELVWEARSLNFGEEDDPLWLVCVTCSSRDAFLTRKVFQTEPTASELWDVLLEAMQRPETGEPHPPMVLMVGANQGWEALKRQLKEMGIVLLKTKDLEYPDGFPEWMNDVWLEWQREKKMEEKRKKKGKAKRENAKGGLLDCPCRTSGRS